jgi:CHAD domain-containing protein
MAKGTPIHKLTLQGLPLRASAPVLMVRWNEMMAWASGIHDPENVAGLHNLRIAAKRLRYTLEIFAPVLPDSDDLLRTVEEVQERIGQIHDCDILFPLLRDTLERESRRERKRMLRAAGPPPYLAAEGLVALIGRKRQERTALYENFLKWWDALPPERVGERLETLAGLAGAPSETAAEKDQMHDAS